MTYWDHVFHTSVCLINKLRSSSQNFTILLQTFFHKAPDYNLLKVFGCACFPHLRPYNTNKLQFQSTKFTFLGYSLSHKGYKCFDHNGRLFISKDVIFHESRFPHSLPKSVPSNTTDSSSLLPLGVYPSNSTPHV